MLSAALVCVLGYFPVGMCEVNRLVLQCKTKVGITTIMSGDGFSKDVGKCWCQQNRGNPNILGKSIPRHDGGYTNLSLAL